MSDASESRVPVDVNPNDDEIMSDGTPGAPSDVMSNGTQSAPTDVMSDDGDLEGSE